MEESKSNPPRTTGPTYKEVCGIYIVQWHSVQMVVYTMAQWARVAFSGIDLVLQWCMANSRFWSGPHRVSHFISY